MAGTMTPLLVVVLSVGLTVGASRRPSHLAIRAVKKIWFWLLWNGIIYCTCRCASGGRLWDSRRSDHYFGGWLPRWYSYQLLLCSALCTASCRWPEVWGWCTSDLWNLWNRRSGDCGGGSCGSSNCCSSSNNKCCSRWSAAAAIAVVVIVVAAAAFPVYGCAAIHISYQPPEEPKPWEGVFVADTLGAACS